MIATIGVLIRAAWQIPGHRRRLGLVGGVQVGGEAMLRL
jgi:hypothetical protein